MLYSLSRFHVKNISIFFTALFFVSGFGSLKAQLSYALVSSPESAFLLRSPVSYARPANQHSSPVLPMVDSIRQLGLKAQANVSVADAAPERGQIGGPSQPEMSSFKSVGADNMVSPFTGDFSYNIPLMDVGGYPINLFYNSGITMDQEASWVGLGWNINPGTITRNMRGIPDDFNGKDEIIKTQSFRPDETFGLTVGGSFKIGGFPIKSAGVTLGLSWNNKLGVAASAGVNAALKLTEIMSNEKTYGLSFTAGLNASSRDGASFSPAISISNMTKNAKTGDVTRSLGIGYTYSSRAGLSQMHVSSNVSRAYKSGSGESEGSDGSNEVSEGSDSKANHMGTLSFVYPTIVPTITKPLTNTNFSLTFSGGSAMTSAYAHGTLRGYYSKTEILPEDIKTRHSAYGVLHYDLGRNDSKAVLDFNRINDGVYTPNNPTIAIPVYTYDVFSITGEGTGGSFRAYRRDIGHMNDALVATKSQNFSLGLDLGFGNILHAGASLNYINSQTWSSDWTIGNMAQKHFEFKKNISNYDPAVYFKNPGEKTIPDRAFQIQMQEEDLVRFKLDNPKSPSPLLLPKLIRYNKERSFVSETELLSGMTEKQGRDKQTQVISFLTAEEAERIGMSRKIYSYNATGPFENSVLYGSFCNRVGIDSFYRNHFDKEVVDPTVQSSVLGGESIKFRQPHHISQVDVLGSDGRKYVYGIPVYNKKQVNVSFSVNQSDKKGESKAVYSAGDDTEANNKGRDWLLEKEEIPPYAHSFLLTEVTSPNYVDVTENGVSEDDMGDAIKFNYTKYNDFYWRSPSGMDGEARTANYSSGLRTDEKDDKAHYIFGKRESWYLYSIESKNMVARFFVLSDRKDGKSVKDEEGELDLNAENGQKRLYKICLYSKGDLAKHGNNAKAIKTVQFFHSYKLCVNNPASATELGSNIERGSGKLTLESILITYNGNNRKAKSRYVFYYPTDNNPNYHFSSSDRWGNYKPKSDNPQSNGTFLTNEEFPYATQDPAKANRNAAAWALNKILLPSGGVISIDYESDSYAFVQARRAACMYSVLGFGSGSTMPAASELNKLYSNSGAENYYVYIRLSQAISSTGLDGKREFAAKYLADVNQLYLRLFVSMPTGYGLSGLAGEEIIPVYADIDGTNYGLIDPTTAWIKVKDIGTNHTPMVQTALQFIMKALPGKAYKGYDLSDEQGMEAVIRAMAGMLKSLGSLTRGELNTLKSDLKGQQVLLSKSFARLANPNGHKLGGGHRVKRIVVSDNWERMTSQPKSTYGFDYKYTTKEMINGEEVEISSGVACWEPSIGNEENPYKEIMRYMDHTKGGPFDYGSVETPLGEVYYPSPFVGYSKVEKLSIHRDAVKNPPVREVTEFYTTREFPYRSSNTVLAGDANARYEPKKILQLLRIDMMKSVTQTQGFLIETNDMNGKEKQKSVFAFNNPSTPFSYTQYYYNLKKESDKTYSFDHEFMVVEKADGVIKNQLIGREIELMTDFREHNTETITANLDINFDGFVLGFCPVAINNLFQPVVREGTRYQSAAILKIVTHYGMLDSVVVVNKGSMVSTKNLLYDAETGNPILTRTQNEHNRTIYNFNYPAHWAYSGMGPAYRNIDAVFTGVNFGHGTLRPDIPDLVKYLESGDELYVVSTASENDTLTAIVPCDNPADYTPENMPWATYRKNPANRIWAVNTAKPGNSNGLWVFMDANGHPYNAKNATVRIVRSGHRNMLDQSVGTITSLDPPIVDNRLVFNDSRKIMQVATATFKENWRVDNSFYKVEETEDQYQYARVHRREIMPTQSVNVRRYIKTRHEDTREILPNSPFIHLQKFIRPPGDLNRSENERRLGFLLYEDVRLPNRGFYKATMSLFSHTNSIFQGLSADHAGWHSSGSSSNVTNVIAELDGLRGSWMGGNADAWVNNYFNNNLVSVGKGIVPYSNGWSDNYNTPSSRINVSLPYLTSVGATLFNQNKFGLRLRMGNDDIEPHDHPRVRFSNYRCFWSHHAQFDCQHRSPSGQTNNYGLCRLAAPKLYFYDYQWGNVDQEGNAEGDPSVNLLISKFIQTVTNKYCQSKFQRKAINPYVEGVLGNWRVDYTYVYYGERKEGDLSNPAIDLRVAGTIKNFKPFWNFAAEDPTKPVVYLTKNPDASDVWVWNSQITQFNRKGYEIENTDPLGRYNAGLYGYNQQLPVAVANNSRVREVLFDGFEDYDYETVSDNCLECKPKRHIKYDQDVTQMIDVTQKHSGKNSLRLNSGQSLTIEAPVVSKTVADEPYGVTIQGVTTTYTDSRLGPGGVNGTGLRASWYNHAVSGRPRATLEPASSNSSPQAALIHTAQPVVPGYPVSSSSPPVPGIGVSQEYFSVKWEGKLQAPVTGTYRFRLSGDNGFRIKVNGVQLSPDHFWNNQFWQSGNNGMNNTTGFPYAGGIMLSSDEISLIAGQVYPIEISFYNQWGPYNFSVLWRYRSSNGSSSSGFGFSWRPIPVNHLYPPDATSFREVISQPVNCNRLENSQVNGNALTDLFSPIQQSKMILSGWVKVGTATCCFPATYDNGSNIINVSYKMPDGSNVAASDIVVKPAGPVIEGWQRYESKPFTIHQNAASMNITLTNSSSGSAIFFDDIRVQPFNANMKTFVYNSSNLRLMAELDENNYASYFEYDDDGTLTRIKKETVHGIKTIKETRSATQKIITQE